MTQQQTYQACIVIAPDFQIGIVFGVLGRVLTWSGTPRGSSTPLSAGIQFPDTIPFEQNFTFLLNQALLTLQKATP